MPNADTPATSTDTLRLQVAALQGPDVGKGVARLSNEALAELGLGQGGIIEIVGKRTTAAVALPPYPQDEGLHIVRLDGLQRHNAEVGLGDHVEVRRGEVRPAQRVVVAPAQKNIQLSGPGQALLRTLLGRPLTAGDLISTSVYRREPGMDSGPYPEDILRQFFQQRAFGLQEIRLTVVSTAP